MSRARHRYPGCAARLRNARTGLGAAVALYRKRRAGCRFRRDGRAESISLPANAVEEPSEAEAALA